MLVLWLVMTVLLALVVNELLLVCRDDQGEGGERGPVIQRVCGEEEVGTGEVR